MTELSIYSGLRYGWHNRTLRGGVMQFRGEMFRLQTDYFPCLNRPEDDTR